MTITPMELYFVLMLDNIRDGISILLILCTIAVIIVSVLALASKIAAEENGKDSAIGTCSSIFFKSLKWLYPLLIIVVLAKTLTPSTKQMAAIILVPKLANSELVQKDIPRELSDIYAILKNKLLGQDSGNENEKTENE